MDSEDKTIVGAYCVREDNYVTIWQGVYEDKLDKLLDDNRDEASMNVLLNGEDAITEELARQYPAPDAVNGIYAVGVTTDSYKRPWWVKPKTCPVFDAFAVQDEADIVMAKALPRYNRLVVLSGLSRVTRTTAWENGIGNNYTYRTSQLAPGPVSVSVFTYEPYAHVKEQHRTAMSAYRETQKSDFTPQEMRDLLRALGPKNWPAKKSFDCIELMTINDSGGWGRSTTNIGWHQIASMFRLMTALKIKVKDLSARDYYSGGINNVLEKIRSKFCAVEASAKGYTNQEYCMKVLRAAYRGRGLKPPRPAREPREPKELKLVRKQKARARRQAARLRRQQQVVQVPVPGIAA